jgi:hypothetical protein
LSSLPAAELIVLKIHILLGWFLEDEKDGLKTYKVSLAFLFPSSYSWVHSVWVVVYFRINSSWNLNISVG